ncbi:RING-H2 finger protein ATL34-like [Abeliophyllum distichum]|uniref:RING-H2 finger protein ATL34-like n=1 Tax=Abeliophyllum distichum TaxID=126358 RepID=A0ABD1NUJ7_9LAMI
MDFDTPPVDDYCRAWQAYDLDIPKIGSSDKGDHFFIEVHMEKTYFSLEDEEEEPNYLLEYDCDTSISTFWEPCERVERNNLPLKRISKILCEVGVPLHRQDLMLNEISDQADEICNSPHNKNEKILSMIVSISIAAVKPN